MQFNSLQSWQMTAQKSVFETETKKYVEILYICICNCYFTKYLYVYLNVLDPKPEICKI